MKSLLFALVLTSSLLANDKFVINMPVAIQIGHTALELNHEHSSVESTMLFVGISPTIVSNFISCAVGLNAFIAAYDNNKTFSEQTPFNITTYGLASNIRISVKVDNAVNVYAQTDVMSQFKYGETDFNGKVNHILLDYRIGFTVHDKYSLYVGRTDSKLINYIGNVSSTIFIGYEYMFTL